MIAFFKQFKVDMRIYFVNAEKNYSIWIDWSPWFLNYEEIIGIWPFCSGLCAIKGQTYKTLQGKGK